MGSASGIHELRLALILLVALATALAGCTDPGQAVDAPPEGMSPSTSGEGVTPPPRLTNATWPDMQRAIEDIEKELKNATAPSSIPDGGLFIYYQAYAEFDLERGWLLNAPYSVAIATDILKRGQMAETRQSIAEVQAQSDEMEDSLRPNLSVASDLCALSSGFLIARSTLDDATVREMQASGASEDAMTPSASFRWAQLAIATQLAERDDCEPTTARPDVITWAEGLIAQDAAYIDSTYLATETKGTLTMLEWAKANGSEALREMLAVRAAAYAEMSRLAHLGQRGPDLGEVARVASEAFETSPRGARAWEYSGGTMAYTYAADNEAAGLDDPVASAKAAVFFAASSEDPESAYVRLRT